MKEIVVVTGAAKGIGRVLAKGFAKKGMEVIALDILKTKFSEDNIYFYNMDLELRESIEKTFKKIKKDFGRVDIIINNGAISKFNKSLFDIEIEDFEKVIDVNLKGTFICVKEFLKLNKGNNFGRIINIASTRANQGESGWEAYCASKGGMISMTQTMAVSLAETKITANCISPGWIECDEYERLEEVDHSQHPSGRVGKPEDILRMALFLSEKENDFINGENIIIDGGMTKKMIYQE